VSDQYFDSIFAECTVERLKELFKRRHPDRFQLLSVHSSNSSSDYLPGTRKRKQIDKSHGSPAELSDGRCQIAKLDDVHSSAEQAYSAKDFQGLWGHYKTTTTAVKVALAKVAALQVQLDREYKERWSQQEVDIAVGEAVADAEKVTKHQNKKHEKFVTNLEKKHGKIVAKLEQKIRTFQNQCPSEKYRPAAAWTNGHRNSTPGSAEHFQSISGANEGLRGCDREGHQRQSGGIGVKDSEESN
jgi:hypothetical protein